MSLVKRGEKQQPISAPEYDAVVEQVEENKSKIDVVSQSIVESKVLYALDSDAAMLAKWNELDAAGNTPENGRESIFRTDTTPPSHWAWDSTKTNKAVFVRDVQAIKSDFDKTNEGDASTMKTSFDFFSNQFTDTFYKKPLDAKVIERVTFNEFDFNSWVKNVEIIPNEGVTVDVSNKEIYLIGFLRQVGTSGITLHYGNESLQINRATFSGDMELSFALPTAQLTFVVTLENVPTGIFSEIGDIQRADFDNDKINVLQQPTATSGVLESNEFYVENPAYSTNNLFERIFIDTNYYYKYITFKITELVTSIALTNRKESLYPDNLDDYKKYVVITDKGYVNGVQTTLDFSKEIQVLFGEKRLIILQDNNVIFQGEHINDNQSKTFTIGSYFNLTNVIEYVKVQDPSVFYDKNIYLKSKEIFTEEIKVDKVAEIPAVFGYDSDISINFKESTKINQRKFEAIGGEVVTGNFGEAGAIYRIKPKLEDEYKVQMKFNYTDKLLNYSGTRETSLVRTLTDPTPLNFPDYAFKFNLSQDNSTAQTIFARAKGNYTREKNVDSDDGYGSFRLTWTGTIADAENYTLTVNATNLIIKNGATTVINIAYANHSTQHDVLKELIDANIPNIKVNIMGLSDNITDWNFLEDEPFFTQGQSIADASASPAPSSPTLIDTVFPIWVYNYDKKEHLLEIISNPNSPKKFYYKFDGEINDVLDKTNGEQTSEINDWIYFGGFDNVSAPIKINEIKISKDIKQEYPKVIYLMVHTPDSGLVAEADELEENGGDVNPYFHTSSEHLSKWKMLFDELGYVNTSIFDLRDYARYGKIINDKCFCIIYDDQQSVLWDLKDVRETFFDMGIKPVTGWITAWAANKDSIRKSVGYGWEYVSHTYNHTRQGELTYEFLVAEHENSQAVFQETFGKHSDILVGPFGSLSKKAIETLTTLGYNLFITTIGILISPFGNNFAYITRINGAESNDFSVLEAMVREQDKY